MFISGDIHGDVLILLEIGNLTNLFGCEDIDKLIHIHRNYADMYKQKDVQELLGSDLGLHHINWTTGYSEELYLLGDIVDNYRSGKVQEHASSAEPRNNMAMDAEIHIVQTLVRLKQEAIQEGGNIHWVIGNHDLANVTNDALACSHYTTVDQCDPTDKTKYLTTRSNIIRDALLTMGAKAVHIVDGLLLCHGGFSDEFADACISHGLVHVDGKIDVDKINKVYTDYMVRGISSRDTEWLHTQIRSGRDVTWCRPASLKKWKPLNTFKKIYGTIDAMVVAHTIQEKIGKVLLYVNNAFGDVVDGKMVVSDGYEPWYDGEEKFGVYVTDVQPVVLGGIYMMDLAMSRAFDDPSVTPYQETFCTIGVMNHTNGLIRYHARIHPRCIG